MIEHGPQLADRVSIDIAWLYCATLIHNGYSDWRMPTTEEVSRMGWFNNDFDCGTSFSGALYIVTPVRDINVY